jgi:hypothetical protein
MIEIPPFQEYFPQEEKMSPEQRSFYLYLEKEIARKNYVKIQGQISYLFVYSYKILEKRQSVSYINIYDELMHIAEAYHYEKNFSKICKFWAADCLLADNKYELYIEQTEPETPVGREKLISNIRLNIQMMYGLPINGVDLFKMVSGQVSKPTKKHLGLFKDFLLNAPEKYQIDFRNWLENSKIDIKRKERFKYNLFSSSIYSHPHNELTIHFYEESSILQEQIVSLARRVENDLRESVGLPKIGEGWISETELYYFLKERFSQTSVVQHGKPDWLGKQHFDIWFPRWRIAVEYHGRQHFEPVDFFGGKTSLEETQKRDERKRILAKSHKVKLFVVKENESFDEVAKQIENI